METVLIFKASLALIIKFINIILHSVGIHLLRSLPENDKRKVQVIYIMNLSVTELILNTISFFRNIIKLIPHHEQHTALIMQYSYVFDYAVLKCALYLTMIVLTLDRILLVLYNVRYPSCLSANRAKLSILFIWLVCALVFIMYLLFFMYLFKHSDYESCKLFNYVVIAFDMLFLSIAVLAYSLIFRSFVKQKRKKGMLSVNGENESEKRRTLWKVFRESRFYVAVLLISTFTVFVVVPDFVFAFHACQGDARNIRYITTICYAISYFSDALIYVFLNDKVRKLFVQKLRKMKASFLGENSSDFVNEETGYETRRNSQLIFSRKFESQQISTISKNESSALYSITTYA